jgi:hypothetical protein
MASQDIKTRRPGALAPLVLALGMTAAALPAAAEDFSSHEGFTDSGAPKWAFEIDPYLYLPYTSATFGLNRAPGDETINLPRPTIASLSKLNGAFTSDAIGRYGNWSGELNILYIAASSDTSVPLPGPGANTIDLHSHLSVFYISPGLGYRVYHSDKVSLDARVGFNYFDVSGSSDFVNAPDINTSHGVNWIQPWIADRLSYYPSRKWRITNELALTGLGVDGGKIGWRGSLTASYLVSSWFDVSLGYGANQTYKSDATGPLGENRSVNILEYGPLLAVGFRF